MAEIVNICSAKVSQNYFRTVGSESKLFLNRHIIQLTVSFFRTVNHFRNYFSVFSSILHFPSSVSILQCITQYQFFLIYTQYQFFVIYTQYQFKSIGCNFLEKLC